MAKSKKHGVDRKEELRSQINNLREQLDTIELQEKAYTNSYYLSKCYKYKNSYSGDSEAWWIYAKVLEIDKFGDLYCARFQKDCYNRIRIELYDNFLPSHSWIEIPQSEFGAEWLKVLNDLNSITVMAGGNND